MITRLFFLLAASLCAFAQSPRWFFIQMSDPQFGMFTDNHGFEQETANFEFAIATANRLKPAFVVVTGDLVNNASNDAQVAQYKHDAALATVPLYSVAGNHDVGNEPTPASLARYRERFGRDYYTFQAPDTLAIVLNSNLIKAPQNVQEDAARQEQWLRATLAQARRDGVKHVIVFQHIPFFISDPNEPDQYFNIPLEARRRYLALLHEYNVEHVYAGHLHHNAYGRDGALEMVSTGPVGKPLGADPSGFRIITVDGDRFESHYYGLGDMPSSVDVQPAPERERRATARELGISTGILPPGPLNAITDVAGVAVGHTTVIRGDDIRTGVTAILPHGGNLFREKVAGAVFIGNAFGKLAGSTQVNELGEIETPILLTSTLNVPRVADALIDYMLALPGNERVQSINPLVGETNDGYLNDIRSRPVTRQDVFAAIRNAKPGAVEQGAVGAGTGTVAFGFKGGIGTSSRKLPEKSGGYTVGVLVQTNFGGTLTIAGAPVGRELKPNSADGSCMIVVATDAPVDSRNLKRLAARTMFGLARTGSAGSNGSGDYAIAFSTSHSKDVLGNDAMSPLFLAAIEATEEAIYNSLFMATTTTGRGHTVKALPIASTIASIRSHAK